MIQVTLHVYFGAANPTWDIYVLPPELPIGFFSGMPHVQGSSPRTFLYGKERGYNGISLNTNDPRQDKWEHLRVLHEYIDVFLFEGGRAFLFDEQRHLENLILNTAPESVNPNLIARIRNEC